MTEFLNSKLEYYFKIVTYFLIFCNTSVSRWWELDPRPFPYHGNALPLSYIGGFYRDKISYMWAR